MSVSTNYASTVINLYCNEAPDDVVSLNTKISEINSLSIEDESFLSSIFDSELDQMPETGSVTRIRQLPDVVASRKDAVNWMLKVLVPIQLLFPDI